MDRARCSLTAGIIEYARCEQNMRPARKIVKLRAPIGISNVYSMTGEHILVRDGTVEVSEENRGPLMAAGASGSGRSDDFIPCRQGRCPECPLRSC